MKFKHPDTWYSKAAPLLASGVSQAEVAKACGVSVRSLKRHLAAPGSVLARLVEQEKAQLVATTEDQRASLLEKAMEVLTKNLDVDGKNGLDAAKAVLAKLLPTTINTQVAEPEPEPEITPEEACREVSLSLSAFAGLARIGQLSPAAVEGLRTACREFLEDDLQPHPPIDLEADRVEMMGSEEADQVSDGNGASVIPIRH